MSNCKISSKESNPAISAGINRNSDEVVSLIDDAVHYLMQTIRVPFETSLLHILESMYFAPLLALENNKGPVYLDSSSFDRKVLAYLFTLSFLGPEILNCKLIFT